MALVKCPECGKENISDSAMTCPSCGYGIKEHFERIEQEKTFMEQKQKRQENLQESLEYRLKQIDSMPRPYKPSLSSILFQRDNALFFLLGSFGILILLCGVGFVFVGDVTYTIYSLVFGVPACVVAYILGKDIKKDYDNAMDTHKNWDSYKERLKHDIKNRYETDLSNLKEQKFVAQQSTAPYKEVAMPQPSHELTCPVCGSPRVKKISTMSRAVSIELVGLASSKIGKQYECQKCKHKW